MKSRPSSFRRKIAIILVWQFSLVAGLPAGVHLKLCFAVDGHIDITSATCSKSLVTIPHTATNLFHHQDHHDDCVDLELDCTTFDSGQRAINHAGSLKPRLSGLSGVTGINLFPLAGDANQYSYGNYPVFAKILHSSHLIHLRPIDLLI